MNSICATGRICSDPEVQYTTANKPYILFRLACERNYKNRNGEKMTDFIDCACWGKLSEIMEKNTKKGDRIFVTGELQSRIIEKDGLRRTFWTINCIKVEFLNSRSDSTENQGSHISYKESDIPF